MKAVLALVMLAVGMTLGFGAGMVIRDPQVITNPRILLPQDAPDSCLQVIDSAEEMSKITRDYLSLVRDTYVPMLQQYAENGGPSTAVPSAAPSATPSKTAVNGMLTADQRLADLSDRTAVASAKLNEAKVVCRSRVRP